jgi:hypothetical protein
MELEAQLQTLRQHVSTVECLAVAIFTGDIKLG